MKPPKKLSRDYKHVDQPPGTKPFGKNGIRNGNTDSVQNEPGFGISSAVIPYEINGVIETDTFPLIFSTDDTFSAIGFYDDILDTYTPVVNDADEDYKLNFKRNRYIKGEARRNYKNNIEVAWLDKLNPLRFMDTVEPPTTLQNYLLFPEYTPATLSLEIVNGGTLELGAYFAAARYINDDGTETRYSTATNPIFALSANFAAIPGASTGKSLKINLSGLDTKYNKVQVAVIRRMQGVTTVVELPAIPITGDTSILYTGTEGEDITLEEVLIPGAFYNNAGSITQLNDILYIADMEEAQVFNLQKYATLIKIRWKSEFHDNIDSDEDIKTGKIRTFKHGEAYAFYVQFKIGNGTVTDLFHIPGPAPTVDNLANDVKLGSPVKKYQTNTVGMLGINTTERTGETGVWVNKTEVYPTGANAAESFDASGIGGEDLRGQAVRHHKMPTLNQTLNYFYSQTGSKFGITGLDVLGIQADNIVLPPEMQGVITGYEIFYAKRSYSNATIASQGQIMLGAKSGYTGNDVYFTAGNFDARLLRSDFSSTDNARRFNLTESVFKLNHADLMLNRPAIIPTFLASNYKIEASIGRAMTTRDNTAELNFVADYFARGSMKDKTYYINGVQDTGYLLNNGSKGIIKNNKSEDGFVGTFQAGQQVAISKEAAIKQAAETEGNVVIPNYEQAWLVDVVTAKDDIYKSFTVQDAVRTGVINSVDAAVEKKFSFNGDCFLVIHSYWSYGMVDSPDRFYSNPGRVDGMDNDDEDTYTDEFYAGTSGTKVARRYITESSMNLWQRYADPAIPESKFWPLVNSDFMNGMDRNKDNNVISLSSDASSIGDLLNGVKTYDFEQVNIKRSPYKITRSSKQAREGRANSWKNFNALDYFETDKNMGPIVNLQGYGDRLIIHHRNAIFITQDKTTLQGDILSVTLGTGDIFRFPPQPGKPSKLGYAGTQHQLACMMTDFGYVFPDAETGIWFVLNGEGLNELNGDLYNFFKEYLNVPEINPFVGNGICVGYDSEYKRLLITVKNKQLSVLDDYVPNYQETPEFFAKLVPGESVVFNHGRYLIYKGENTSEFACTVYPPPVLGNYIFNIDELQPTGFLVGQLVATGESPLQYVILSGNIEGAFSLDSSNGKLYVSNSAALDTAVRDQVILNVKVTDTHGGSDTATVTVNLAEIELPPMTEDYLVQVNENSANDFLITMVAATDPKDLTLTWSIVSQSVAGAVKINAATGALSVNDTTKFDYETNQLMDIVVRVTNTIPLTADSQIRIIVMNVNEAPVVADETVDILESATGVIAMYDLPVDPDTNAPAPVVTVVSQSVPDAFLVDLETREVSVNPAHTLDESNSPYIITLKAADGDDPTVFELFTVTVNVGIPVPECPDRALVFQICNSNASKDDNFDIYLNDTLIGAVDLNADSQIGSVFIASLDTPDITSADFVCPLVNMVTYYFDPALVVGGINTINMVNTQANNNGNFGTIGVRNYLIDEITGDLSAPCVVADLEYGGATGASFELTFNYTACCPED